MKTTKLSTAVSSDFKIRRQQDVEKENISAIAKCLWEQDEDTLGKYVELLGEEKVEAYVELILKDLENEATH